MLWAEKKREKTGRGNQEEEAGKMRTIMRKDEAEAHFPPFFTLYIYP